jgi:glucose uptake protein
LFTVHDSATAIFLCFLTMLGWGSWANTQKLAGKEKWPFELFYWDYSVGVALTGLIFFLTLGVSHLGDASRHAEWTALASGALFNLANVLLVAAIDAAGMAVAFPVGIGLALIIGTAVSYLQTPKGSAAYLLSGVLFILLAMIFSGVAYSRLPRLTTKGKNLGLIFSIAAGLLMGFFYPQLMRSMSSEPGMLTPYGALLFFGIGVLVSSIPINGWFMHSRGSKFSDFTAARPKLHIPGILGGAIWMAALGFNVLAAGVAGPAVSYALGQGATLIAALWGVFVWHEFRGAPAGTNKLLAIMLAAYAVGLVLIGRATLS